MASAPPHNFSWVEPGKLAGLAMPRMPCEYRYLLDNGIKHLVCLCERKPPNHDTCPELQLHHIKIADFTPPSPNQIDRFLSVVEEANSKGEAGAQALIRTFRSQYVAYEVFSQFNAPPFENGGKEELLHNLFAALKCAKKKYLTVRI